jgi:ubiquinone/menaquinone biosynthesis C-methylase UbiE
MTTLPTWQLYDGAAESYERYRPGYPQGVFDALNQRVADTLEGAYAIDVGAGTGIFSRSLLHGLPQLAGVVCVEPNEDMVRVGREAARGQRKIRYERGFAEALPAADGTVMLVTAATAAHWFDRPKFFAEAARVLRPDGLLALLQNKLRYWDDPLAADFAAFMERCIPGYQRGLHSNFHGGYSRVDFAAELRSHEMFDAVIKVVVPWHQDITPTEFRGMCYSMGHIKKAEANVGAAKVSEEIEALIHRHVAPNGLLRIARAAEITMADARKSAPLD